VIQATLPRIPCFKFGNKVGKPDILEKFLFSGFSGFYHKVIEEGEVSAGDKIEFIHRDTNSISIREALGLYKLKEGNAESLSHALTIQSLPPLLRENYESRLEKLRFQS
jgi:MOSC domain-containing protein YiiM